MKLLTKGILFISSMVLAVSSANAQLACTKFFPSGAGSFGIFNNCTKCMTASMAWCDGTIHRSNVPANNGIVITACIGTVTLVGESPCSNDSMKSLAAEKPNPLPESEKDQLMKASEKTGIATLVTKNRVTSRTAEGAAASGSSCSASNEVGDVCSISCPEGKAAQCQNALGGGAPVCECK